MTPKEKAEELYNKFYSAIPRVDDDGQQEHASAKQCAIIAVDEIGTLKAESFDELPNPHHYFSRKYWNEVKQEIEKL